MIRYKDCPVCSMKLTPVKYTGVSSYTTLWCNNGTNGHSHFHLYDYYQENYQECFSYLNEKLITFSNKNEIIVRDAFGNCSVSNIKSLDDYIALLKRYYKMMAFV